MFLIFLLTYLILIRIIVNYSVSNTSKLKKNLYGRHVCVHRKFYFAGKVE